MKNNKGFTLVEIMIVVAIIGIILAVAIPSFSKAGKTAKLNSCINNIQILEGVSETWVMESRVPNGTQIEIDKLLPYLKHSQAPTCPSGGNYILGKVGDDYPVSCSLPEHNDAYRNRGKTPEQTPPAN